MNWNTAMATWAYHHPAADSCSTSPVEAPFHVGTGYSHRAGAMYHCARTSRMMTATVRGRPRLHLRADSMKDRNRAASPGRTSPRSMNDSRAFPNAPSANGCAISSNGRAIRNRACASKSSRNGTATPETAVPCQRQIASMGIQTAAHTSRCLTRSVATRTRSRPIRRQTVSSGPPSKSPRFAGSSAIAAPRAQAGVSSAVPPMISRIPRALAGAPLRAAIAALSVGILSAPCRAGMNDRLVVRNGDVLTGEIKKFEFGSLRFKTDATDTISVKWDDVLRLSSPEVFQVSNAAGDRYLGTIGDGGDRTILVVGPEGTITLSLDDIVRIAPIEETFWASLDGALSAGFSFTESSGVTQFTLGGNASYRRPNHLQQLSFSS